MIAAVADAGPLIHLHEINQLSLLQIFSPLHIPDSVWFETVGQGRLTLDDVAQLDHVERVSLSQSDVDQFIQEHLWCAKTGSRYFSGPFSNYLGFNMDHRIARYCSGHH